MSATSSKPNILIFMTDQQQAQVTMQDHPCRTPHLDEIAGQGVRFTYTYPPMAHCCPARASFMTGLYPSQHGVYNNVRNDQAINSTVNPGVEMFSEKLKDAGYEMYYSGKWHVSAEENPSDRGWTELYMKEQGFDRGSRRDHYAQLQSEHGTRERARGEILRPGWSKFQLYGTSKVEYHDHPDYHCVNAGIQQLNAMKDQEDPWCMYLGVLGPHDPFIVPEKYATMYDPNDIELPPNYRDDMTDKPGIYRRMKKVFSQLTEQEVKESLAHYWGYCTMMDDLFGEVLDALDRNGQRDNTLIVFVSDHGELGAAHGLYCKGISTFDEGYRVPLIISHPKLIQEPGRSVDDFVMLMDIAPTLIELAGAEPLSKCSGQSLVPFLQNEQPTEWRESIYTQCYGTELYYTNRMVRTKDYKFVYNPTDIDELYDLNQDPHEMVNIAEQPEMSGVLKEMYRLMWENGYRYEDNHFVSYIPVTTGEYGPAIVNEPKGGA
ncbi:putative choline-sulfatase [Paenibacillus algicola]|uniref:Putative choline-sulfatase n=1 Tax=Paenibacillus algicola TaxID=2565926 RepID=A0A4V1G4H8_9BACL|nr:sulfatase-like hydrolase/transferase [Paenibacillus algicola]QCT04744.1 putative choline-sulfatase [Paenibacillus algicola]